MDLYRATLKREHCRNALSKGETAVVNESDLQGLVRKYYSVVQRHVIQNIF